MYSNFTILDEYNQVNYLKYKLLIVFHLFDIIYTLLFIIKAIYYFISKKQYYKMKSILQRHVNFHMENLKFFL